MAFQPATVAAGQTYMKIQVKRGGRTKPPVLDNAQLTYIGKHMVVAQLVRWANGINADGAPAKPLSKRYFFVKRYVTGQQRPIRDNKITGALVKNFQLRKAAQGTIRAEPTQRLTRQHSNRAEQYQQMTGFAPSDTVSLLKNVGDQYQKWAAGAWVQTSA